MSEAAAQLMPTLLALPPEVRLELAGLLRESVTAGMNDGLRADTAVVVETGEEFNAMLTRRAEEMRTGKVKGIPAEEVMARLKAKYG